MLDNISSRYKAWRAYKRTVNELSRLSARELNDLGLNRGDINRVARASTKY